MPFAAALLLDADEVGDENSSAVARWSLEIWVVFIFVNTGVAGAALGEDTSAGKDTGSTRSGL